MNDNELKQSRGPAKKKKEEKKYHEGRYCLKFGKWAAKVVKDGLCESGGDPQCSECDYQAWNVTENGLPVDGFPVIFFLSKEWEMTERIKECRHGNLFLRWKGPSTICKGQWLKLIDDSWIIGSECNCKSPN